MKKLLFIGVVLMSVVSCTSDQGADAEERRAKYAEFVDEPTSIEFENDEYNFGTVVDGDMVKHTFKFTNTGDKNLVLFDVKTTCGCTVPEDWPKQPIPPGESGEVKVIFNSNNKVGAVNKSIRIEANTNPTVSAVTITGEVLAAE
ncbi:MAG: DUF1573 domain-containing protein [Crocinitomix sp.]|nr:DUF1573 domain-containing protein [Crocinitomix sp.]